MYPYYICPIIEYLHNSLKRFHEIPRNEHHFYMMLIVARQLFFYSSINSYKNWVRTTFGELHYKCQNQKEKFISTIKILEKIVQYEMDKEVLDIHIGTAITSPRGHYHSIVEYKEVCKSRKEILALETENIATTIDLTFNEEIIMDTT